MIPKVETGARLDIIGEIIGEHVPHPPEGDHRPPRGDVAMKRIGTMEEVVNVMLFLASDEAGWATGQNIRVNGARHD
jgi:NAD(P)-dependent dehydrogenase (short-subunit alcohol dehydrogenase family)